jgi:hypothetical protein
MDRTPFWIRCVTLGDSGHPHSEFHVWRGNDERPVIFTGDAYWQWGETPYRAGGKGFCWTQALHDGLMGMHSTILHSGNDRFCVIPEHDDFKHVARMWELATSNLIPANFEY